MRSLRPTANAVGFREIARPALVGRLCCVVKHALSHILRCAQSAVRRDISTTAIAGGLRSSTDFAASHGSARRREMRQHRSRALAMAVGFGAICLTGSDLGRLKKIFRR